MNPLVIIFLILLVVSGVGLIVFILLHSGKGTGISDMIASSVYSSQTGTSIVEKNLDRITIVFAVDLPRVAARADGHLPARYDRVRISRFSACSVRAVSRFDEIVKIL